MCHYENIKKKKCQIAKWRLTDKCVWLPGPPPPSSHPPSGPLYGSLLKAWQCFLSSADRLASLHASICRSLVSEDGDRVRTWQKDTFHKKLFGGFKETQDTETGFARAQKPWAKRLKKVWDSPLSIFFFSNWIILLIHRSENLIDIKWMNPVIPSEWQSHIQRYKMPENNLIT